MTSTVPLWLALVLVIGGTSGMAYAGFTRAAAVAQERDAALGEVARMHGHLKRVQAEASAASLRAQKARSDLKEVLDANPTWRDTRTPEPVVDSLCKSLRCVKPSTVPAPAG